MVLATGHHFPLLSTAITPEEALLKLGRCEWLEGNDSAAIDFYTHALQLRPDGLEAYEARGYLWMRMGNPQNAWHDYTSAFRLSGDHEYLAKRAEASMDAGDFTRAIGDLSQAISMGASGHFLRLRAEAYMSAGDRAAAEADFQRMIQYFPEDIHPQDRLALAQIFANTGRLDQALEMYSFLIESKSDLSVDDYSALLLRRGTLLVSMGRHNDALADLNRSVELGSIQTTLAARKLRAGVYDSIGDLASAYADRTLLRALE